MPRSFGWWVAVSMTWSCAHVPSVESAPSYGTVMADVGRRFELLGRAAVGGRAELAVYELGELEEAFEQLRHAAPPKEGNAEVLPRLAQEYVGDELPALRQALTRQDPTALAPAFARAATTCNGCHLASAHGFIEVPLTPGASVPATGPR